MNGKREDNIRSLPKEKYTALSEQNGWSLDFAEGYVNGEVERRRGNPLSCYIRVGLDQYALGFRAGYFKRQNTNTEVRRADGVAKTQQEYGERVSMRRPAEDEANALASDLALN